MAIRAPDGANKMKVEVLQKNIYGRNFQNIASTTNECWLITYKKMLIHCGNDILRIMSESIFLQHHISLLTDRTDFG